eukprot:TRINITY_DN5098_c1_g1_i1.p2 TRINITY_DN5098_c1_g1~~TRINITY_DN5098_c1_g1_i1.p2  ORF type:complete len:100 (-),score=18.59 TRINITY_DN5098_c1_g1_i1:215-514(-)
MIVVPALLEDSQYEGLEMFYNEAKIEMSSAMYQEYIDIRTPFYPDGRFNMTLGNSLILQNESTNDIVSMGFAANVSVEDRTYMKMMTEMQGKQRTLYAC